tara:strand:- start:1914 stop:2378 length:465 start_codon:yes stop_codon:yes gene_type:complete
MKQGKKRMLWWIVLIIGVALLAYIRLAPSDPAVWHKQAYPSGLGEHVSSGGYVWREAIAGDGKDQLRSLDRIVMDTPRTTLLAGSVDEKQITYVTRSAVMGFPDYTTIGVYQGLIEDSDQRYLEINGRLRFGKSDLGVNAKRVKGWLAAFEAGG